MSVIPPKKIFILAARTVFAGLLCVTTNTFALGKPVPDVDLAQLQFVDDINTQPAVHKSDSDSLNTVQSMDNDEQNNTTPIIHDTVEDIEENVENNSTTREVVPDPFIAYNRWMFDINMTLDTNLFRPVTVTYLKHTPKVMQNGVNNFYRNVKEPWIAVNLLLQGRVLSSLESVSRFGINTITTLGFADPAGEVFTLTRSDEDLGQTLAVWGVPAGAYVMLPVFGPSTIRDAFGQVVDSSANLISHTGDIKKKFVLMGGYGMTKRARLMKYEGILEPTYEVVRDTYLQKLQYDISNAEFDPTNDNNEHSEFDESFGDE